MDGKPDGRADTELALNANLPTVSLNSRFADVQPKASASSNALSSTEFGVSNSSKNQS